MLADLIDLFGEMFSGSHLRDFDRARQQQQSPYFVRLGSGLGALQFQQAQVNHFTTGGQMLKGTGFMVCSAGMQGHETTDLEEAREVAADIASAYGKAIIYTALEIVKPQTRVTSKQTALGSALMPAIEEAARKEAPKGLLAAAGEVSMTTEERAELEFLREELRQREAQKEVDSIAPTDATETHEIK